MNPSSDNIRNQQRDTRTLREWKDELLRIYEETNGLPEYRFHLGNGLILTIGLEEPEEEQGEVE